MKPLTFKQPAKVEGDNLKKIEFPALKKPQWGVKQKLNTVKRTLIKMTILVTLTVAISTVLLMLVNIFFESHYFSFQSPVLIQVQSPVVLHDRQINLVSSVTEVQAKEVLKVEEPATIETITVREPDDLDKIVSIVHSLESTNGRAKSGLHVRCAAKGMSNEYGYRALEGFCFDTHEEATATVKDWFERSLAVRDLPASLCRYNTGTASESCTYYTNYLKLAGE